MFHRLFGQNRKLNAADVAGLRNAFDISGIKLEGLVNKWCIVVYEEQSLTLHASQNAMCLIWMASEETLGRGHLGFLSSFQVYLHLNLGKWSGRTVNVMLASAGLGMLQSFVCMTGSGSEEALTC